VRALKNLKEAVRLFLEEAEKMGTLDQILQAAGHLKRRSKLEGPEFVGTEAVSLPMRSAHWHGLTMDTIPSGKGRKREE
jgi:hypothetical protein